MFSRKRALCLLLDLDSCLTSAIYFSVTFRKCLMLSSPGSSWVVLAFINYTNMYCLLDASTRLNASDTGVKIIANI